ncbi:recombinase family protein [Pseudoalteromonas sp. T1lg10]|uniref:recombinase family protein n=1 Tax=Pseudoalteromonas sp. T1lg10 TaxID=2077093 RepID=UPI000CF707D6|nr:recombinase family protein [Pseudoalteromonas sp. T1lg10]
MGVYSTVIAYSYLRLSSKKQMAGYGRERQLENTVKAAQKHGWVLSEKTFEDLGVSGWKGQNVSEGAFSEFLSLVDSGSLQTPCVLICENPDRISRQGVNKSVEIMLTLLRKGVQVYTVSDDRLYSGSSEYALFDLMTWGISAQRGAEESEVKSQRIKDARKRKQLAARTTGIKVTSQCPVWMEYDKASDQFNVLEEKASIVKEIFSLYTQGYGSIQITHKLVASATPPLGRSAKWTPQKVNYILRQQSVIGLFQPMRKSGTTYLPEGEPISDYYPAIIDQQTWEKAEIIKAKSGALRGRKAINHRNIFKGLLKCVCGRAYTLKGGNEDSVRCGSYGTTCKEPTWVYTKLEHNLLLVLNGLDWTALTGTGEHVEQLEAIRHDIEVTKLKLAKADKGVSNLAETIKEMGLDDMLRSSLNEAREQRERLKGQIEKLRQKETLLAAQASNEGNWKRLHQVRNMLDNEEGRHKVNGYLRSLISDITLKTGATPWLTTPHPELPYREHDTRSKGSMVITLNSGVEIEAQVSKDQKTVYWNNGESRSVFVFGNSK